MPSSVFKVSFYIFFCAILTASCKKGNDSVPSNVVLDGSYTTSHSIDFLKLQMFTKNGEVTDQNVIKSYVQGYVSKIKLTDLFTTDAKNSPFQETDLEIDFKNNTEAYVKSISSQTKKLDSVKFDISERSSTAFMLKATDFIKATYNASNSRPETILLKANTIQPFTNCGAVDPNFIFGPVCDYRDEKPFVIKNGKIYKNYISFLISSRGQGTSSWFYIFSRAKFNPEVINQLATNDTLLIQTKQVLYNEK